MIKNSRNPFYLLWLVALVLIIIGAEARDKTELTVFSPPDRIIVYRDLVTVEGSALAGENALVLVGTKGQVIKGDGRFSLGFPLQFGKNLVAVQLVDQEGKLLLEKKIRLLRLKTFKDLWQDNWARSAIENLATLGIVAAFPDGNFLPHASITRAELIKWIFRLNGEKYETGKSTKFNDLTQQHWAFGPIAWAVERGIITGYPDGSFRPDNTVTRVEAITIITRLTGLPKAQGVSKSPFLDISPDYWGYQAIVSAGQAGLLGYIKTAYFEPTDQVSRGEAAMILAGTKTATQRINKLMDFDQGYD